MWTNAHYVIFSVFSVLLRLTVLYRCWEALLKSPYSCSVAFSFAVVTQKHMPRMYQTLYQCFEFIYWWLVHSGPFEMKAFWFCMQSLAQVLLWRRLNLCRVATKVCLQPQFVLIKVLFVSLSGSDLSFSVSVLQHVCIRNRCSFSLSEAVIRPPCCFEFCKRGDDPKKKRMLLCELRCDSVFEDWMQLHI